MTTQAQVLSPDHPLAGGPLWLPEMEAPALMSAVFRLNNNRPEQCTDDFFGLDSMEETLGKLECEFDEGRRYPLAVEEELKLIEILHKHKRLAFLDKHFKAGYAAYLSV